MEINFKGKLIVVTGAGQGIGNELCKRLYKYGATIYAISRSVDPLAELKEHCPNIITIPLDLSNWQNTIAELKILNGTVVHGLVNNAGVAVIKPFSELTESDFDSTINVNLKAVVNVSQQVIKHMGSGSSIVNVSSLAAMRAFAGHSFYSASKAGLDAITRSMALEYGSKNIRINSINPTVVMTRMSIANWSDPKKADALLNQIPLKRFAELDEVVDAIIYLLSDKSSFINGVTLPIEGGYLA